MSIFNMMKFKCCNHPAQKRKVTEQVPLVLVPLNFFFVEDRDSAVVIAPEILVEALS